MASKKRPTAKAAKTSPTAAPAARPKAAPAKAAAARKTPARRAPAATAEPAPAPASAARHDPRAFDAWSAQHLAAGPTARSRARSSSGDADQGELDLAALTRPGAVLEVHFADGSTYYAVPADFLRRHVPAPPPLRSGGPARLALPFDLGGRSAQRSRSAAAASAIEQYAVSELTEPSTLDRLFDVAETFRQTARRWFGIGAGDARTPPLAAKLCAAFENASLHDVVGSGGGALLRWDAGGWVPVGAPLTPQGGKVLLFLHGTASSTASSFGKLWGAKSGGPLPDDFAQLAQSHLLIGWDHRSLTLSPVDNLIGLVEALLARLPAGCTVDVVSHSRGGLVGELFALRSATPAQLKAAQPLFESLFAKHPDRENLALLFQRLAEAGAAFAPGRFVRVACPARGTLLADGRTDLFLSLMLRALKLATSGVGELVLGRVTALVKSLVAARADARHLPGLEAMIPGSPLTLALARCEAQPADRLRVIAGDAAARGLSGLLTLVADVFYGWHDHDYVVHTRSMFGGLKRSAHAPLSLRWEHGSVSHFAYFAPEHPSRKALLATLAGQDDRYAPLAEDERRTRGVLQAMKSDPLTRKLDFDHWLAGSNSAEQRRKPVLVLLAGIMGSELKRRSAPRDEPIWLTLGSMIGGKLDELELKAGGADPLVASGLLAVSYERLLERAQQQFNLLVFPFDWRLPIADSGAALAALLGRVEQALAPDNRVPVHLLVHSMGGLVARHALYIDAAGRALWSTLKQRDSRLVMLGTPNRGSYSPAQLLLRQHSMSQMLGLLARGVSVGDLSRFGAAFPGLMAMLPQEPDPQFGDLFDAAAWDKLVALDSGTIRPDAATLQAARDYVRGAAFQQSFDELLADTHAFYVAGSGDTALQMRPAPNPWGGFFGDGGGEPVAAIEFMAGPGGDGTVPWNSKLADARTWYAPCEHGTLPDHTDSFEAYFELLTGGSTRRLPQQPPRKRGEGDAAAALLPLPLPAGPALLPASDAELADYVLQQRVAQPVAAADPDPIEVRVVHGGLDYARYPLIVSHYQHEPLAGAGKRVDEKLHGQLARVLELRLFVGAAMTAHYLRPNSHSAAEPPYRGALVIGLGSIGELTPGSLADSVTRGVLRYAFEHIHRDPYAPGPEQPVELRLSSLLVGVQSPAFTVRDSLGGLLYGMWRAAQLLMRMGGRERPVRIRELEIVEIDEHTALDAAYELQRLLQRGEWTDRLRWKRPVLEQREGAVSGYRPRGNRSSWQRLLARDDGHGGLAFSLIAERARVESTRVRADVQSLLRLIDRVSDGRADPDDPIQSPTDPRFGGVLYQLLLPPELKTRLVNLDNTVLVVDDATACYPWELLSPPLASAADGEEPRPFVVHAGMVRQRDSSEFLSLPVAPSGYHALIVGAPDTRGWRDERGGELQFTDLPGARAEAERVRELLRGDERWGRPTELISRPPPADPRARLSRWDAKSSEHVRIALLERPYRLLHLCGHGVVDHWIRNDKDGKPVRKTGMLLSDQEILGAVDVEQMSAVPEFVFINCCYSGRDGGDAAVDGGGASARQRAALAASLALAFIRMGSKAVVAAGWQVDDEAALQFADAFYTRLLGGLPFGDAVRIARAEVHARHGRSSNTWGAYQCYGDPQWQLPGGATEAAAGGTSRLRDARHCMSAGELAARVRQVLAVAGDKPPGEVLRQLDRLVSDLEADPLRQGWLADSQVRAALGMAYRELDDHEKAARHLQTGARTAGSEVQIGQLELLMNSLTRVRGERGAAARAASKRLLELLNGIADDPVARWPLTDGELPTPAARSERHCLLGGEYLREAAARLERLEPDDEGRLVPGSKDRGDIATAFERAVVEFVHGYGDKCQERDKAERRSYALSNALLATSLGALFGQPAAALRALGALPGPAAAAAERSSGTPERWLREAQLLMNELTVADDQATFWHQAALLELQLARGLFRNAYTRQPSAEDVAPVRRMIDQVLARWPSPVQLDSLRHRFRLLRFVVLCRAPGQRGQPADAMQGLRLELKKLCDEALDHKLTFPQARSL